ncbi:MAG: TPM domain-containing protein [Lachnospiraceae bacterium]|nr:TPM domain-containing protein [Lachnospiraceae bacterium]
MNKSMKKMSLWLTGCVLGLLFFFGSTQKCLAETVYVNPDTGYEAVIEDGAGLLTTEELDKLAIEMKEATAYGNLMFVSIDYNPNYGEDASYEYAADTLEERYGYESSTIFLIDMDERMIYIYSIGANYKTISKARANTITDNVYRYASDAEYYLCASKAIEQITTVLSGGRIAQPMKYISNAFLALILALLINFIVVRVISKAKKPGRDELLEGVFAKCTINHPKATMTNQTRVYDPPSSSGGGGGGGGGGGHSGGGGGHSF